MSDGVDAGMRVCKHCGKEKPLTAFPFRKAPDGTPYRRHRCSACKSAKYRQDPEKRELCRTHQKKSNRKYRAWNWERKRELLRHIGQLVCKVCEEDDIRALCFHHRDPTTKCFSISKGITHTLSLARLKAEAEKCDVMCLNCHAIHHAHSMEDINRDWPRRQKRTRKS